MAKWKFKFNLMGTPKSGTTAMSKYMKYSIDRHAIFPHENHVPRAPENLGTSSGFWWIDHPWYPYGHQKDWQTYGEDFTYAQCDYDFRIMLIRKPLPTINSLIRLLSMDRKTCLRQDTKEKIESTRWYEDLGFEFYYPNKIHMAMSVYVNTYEYIMENVELDGVVRIEHAM